MLFYFCFFKTVVKKKKIVHFHICMSTLSLFCRSQRRQSRRIELIRVFDQKPADRITKVDLVLMTGGQAEWRPALQQCACLAYLWLEALTGYGWNPHAFR